ncbi:MAG: rhomboid family intramembrane serine protease [Bacteroidales bacterium]|nr:rhomboid family intramembrane serine protease [Bacteroidales bacterium]MBN2818275.1 rhomboid family intramembrane serine protease [Bacteroidales bacterium]
MNLSKNEVVFLKRIIFNGQIKTMIPLKDTIKSARFPVMNWIIIMLNFTVFIFELLMNPEQTEAFFDKFGLIPATTSIFGNTNYTFLTNMFLHGGWLHFLGNMWMLYIFGDNVEDRMGSFRYLVFYLLSGIMASLCHYVLYINSMIPALGASGAISGVMAAYMFLFPKSRIISLVPVFFLPLFIPIPAFIFIGIWFFVQFFNGTFHLLFSNTATGIAFWAHIGGFLAGLIFYKFFVKRKYKKKKKGK